MNAHSFYLKNVMQKAWQSARSAAAEFGGSVRSYFAEALRTAWANIKADQWAKGTAHVLALLARPGMPKPVYGSRGMQGASHWIGR